MTGAGSGSVASWLVEAGAQRDVVDWAEQHAESWAAFWENCPRGDWLLAVAARADVPRGAVIRAALACVTVLHPYLPEREEAIDSALALVRENSKLSDGACDRARSALDELLARCADPSAHAAVLAIQALLATLEDASSAATFVALTVQAAVMDAGDCGMMQAARYTEHECARLTRESISATVFLHAMGEAQASRRADQGSL
jgi:hypothetical protein